MTDTLQERATETIERYNAGTIDAHAAVAAIAAALAPVDAATPRIKMVCSYCGGSDVLADAYAVWSVPAQRWELSGEPFDKGAVCTDCDGETRIEEVPADAGDSRKETN